MIVRTYLLVICTMCMWTITSCQKSTVDEISLNERKAVEDTINHLVLILEKAMQDLDLESSFSLMTDDPDFVFAEDGTVRLFKKDEYEIAKAAYNSFSKLDFAWKNKKILVLGRASAVFTDDGIFTVTDFEGKETKGAVAATYVFQKRKKGWEIIHGHASHAYL
jgi:uncharacterized protein (TIGR02246 family)